MIIPYAFKIRHHDYTVAQCTRNHKYDKCGYFFSVARHIDVYTHQAGVQRKPEQISETFWHEVTHAILHDMEHPLWKDEKFVTAFSKRLNQVINTARLA